IDSLNSPRYYSQYTYVKELVTLLGAARDKGQDVRVISVVGTGLGMTIATDDLGLEKARRGTIRFLKGTMLHFAAQHPDLAFMHIRPGAVDTPGGVLYMGRLLSPLTWLISLFMAKLLVIPQVGTMATIFDDCAQYMLYGLFNGARGLFIRNQHGD
ncbi:hypothetical protein B0H17DRAFT_865844, partial [Mycena rosella]